jgi:hypothetical protein
MDWRRVYPAQKRFMGAFNREPYRDTPDFEKPGPFCCGERTAGWVFQWIAFGVAGVHADL